VGVLRYRVHGVLHALAEFDIRLLPRIIEQWKRMAACNVRETARLQDGRIILDVGDEQVGLRVCFLPAALGETVAVRILNRDVNAMLDLGRINYATEDKARLLRALDKPSGLIVVSGPAGCGKTTVLYSCIKHLAGSERKTMTVEEPVEVLLPWTVQIQAGPQERVSRPAALRSILRSDPDVIMIGELRDKETLDLAIECALTGHLVISTMHVRTAPATLTRMIDMGADAFSLSEATRLIVAQRLVRVLCPKCARAGKPPESRLSRAGELARAGGLDWDKLGRDFRTPIGCAKCHETGYSGRNVIAEVLAVTDELRTALGHGASLDELQAIAVREGMTTLAADGIRRAAEGQTSLEEVMRVVGNG
jgi:type II secretory ATPase GspE/PulE/Tfp pilus assembly ATPase PilB-like protein